MYSREIERLLNAGKILDGDSVEVQQGNSSYGGILLPRTGEVPEDVLTLKLDNGYNIGLKFVPGLKITKRGSPAKLAGIPRLKIVKSSLPSIALIISGGTIGTHIDYRTGGVFMSRDAEELLSTVPELQQVVNIKTLQTLFQTASEDFSVENWQKMAQEIAKAASEPENRGVIVTHGTDVMHYTSAAMAFMLQNLAKPIAIVGAQRSPDRGSFDGTLNLICGAYYASLSDVAEVAVVMHGSSSDEFCYAHRGTKVRKMHTTRRDAFRSINDRPLAKIYPDGKIEPLNPVFNKRPSEPQKTSADTSFEKRIAMLKIYPNANPEILDFLVDRGYRGVVLEATALGHVPTGESGTNSGFFDPKMSWLPSVRNAVDKGVFVAVASQALYGRTSSTVYRNLRLLRDAGGVALEDMLPETAYVKLGWVLAHSKSAEETKKLMLSNLRGEINPRLTGDEFLQ
ncbi:MAG TPA: Glu-tRNA(Gln) amidotransferase subunit GatD [Candidatus Norongarragalinales archaeon]|nr:Glu-tRNA(Gln) amidotransferase subunit GatD [Candidatus Norongarragalinales archaeon]